PGCSQRSIVRASSFVRDRRAVPAVYTLSLHDALPISAMKNKLVGIGHIRRGGLDFLDILHKFLRRGLVIRQLLFQGGFPGGILLDRKSTRLNSSHVKSWYAVFCLKTKR